MDLSIVIVNWNTKDYLISCIRSVIEDTEKIEREIIVVDNASTDGSVEAIQRLFSDIKIIINKQNLGFAKANNIGIKKSKGKYVCLLNSDIIVKPGCFIQLINFMENNYRIGIVGPKLLNEDETLQISCRYFPSILNSFWPTIGLNKFFKRIPLFSGDLMFHFNHESVRTVDALTGAFLLARRSAIKEVGLLDERFFMYGEEIDWCKRFGIIGWEVVFYPQSKVIHFGGVSSSLAPIKNSISFYESQIEFWKKYYAKSHTSIYIIIIKFQQITRYLINFLFSFSKFKARYYYYQKMKINVSVLKWLFSQNTFK